MLREWQAVWPYLGCGVVLLGMTVALAMVWARLGAVGAECRRERRGREEMEAYLRMDVRTSRSADLRELGGRVCGVVAARSVFSRVAVLLTRDAGGELCLAASQGLDEETAAAFASWAAGVTEREHEGRGAWGTGVPLGTRSLVLSLGEAAGRVVAIPMRSVDSRVCGALVVCAESVLEVPRRYAEEAVAGLEALTVKLERALEEVEPVRRIRGAGRVERIEYLTGEPDAIAHRPVQGRGAPLHERVAAPASAR